MIRPNTIIFHFLFVKSDAIKKGNAKRVSNCGPTAHMNITPPMHRSIFPSVTVHSKTTIAIMVKHPKHPKNV